MNDLINIAETGDEQAAAIASVSHGALTLDPTVQYQFRAETAQGKCHHQPPPYTPYVYMTKLYGYDRNDNGIMLNKRIYWEHPKQDSNSNI